VRIVSAAVRWAAVAAFALALAGGRAMAQQTIVNEVKLGVLAHDIGFLGDSIEAGPDVNLEMLFNPPAFLRVIGSPRPDIGGTINTAGNTSDAYAGLTWGVTLLPSIFPGDHGVFLNGSLGGAVNDGYVNNAPPDHKILGSPVLFHLSTELGYQVTQRLSVSAYLEHMSNADLATHNAGITSAGARFGVKF
jgi:lipid A 3-O-deacylase